MARTKYLIIGAGPAALNAAKSIRSVDRDGQITMVSREDRLPYSPAILPYLISGRTKPENIWLASQDELQKLRISLVKGKEAVKISPASREVAYRDGSVDSYEILLLASGAQPLATGFASDVMTFRNLDDFERLNVRLAGAKEVTVLGAGMIAVELAVALVEKGKNVRLVGRGRPLRAYFEAQAGAYVSDILTQHGVVITTGKEVTSVKEKSGHLEVTSTDGEVFRTGLLVSCLGVAPGLGLVADSGIKTNRGVLVDSQMRTNVEGVFAAGDVAESPSLADGHPGVSAILPNAIAQGRVAGENMAGGDAKYAGWVSMNLLKFFGNSAFSIGESGDENAEVLETKDDAKKVFKRLVFKQSRLAGAMLVNVAADPGVMRYLIEKRVDIGSRKEALFDDPGEVSRFLMLRSERGVAV